MPFYFKGKGTKVFRIRSTYWARLAYYLSIVYRIEPYKNSKSFCDGGCGPCKSTTCGRLAGRPARRWAAGSYQLQHFAKPSISRPAVRWHFYAVLPSPSRHGTTRAARYASRYPARWTAEAAAAASAAWRSAVAMTPSPMIGRGRGPAAGSCLARGDTVILHCHRLSLTDIP